MDNMRSYHVDVVILVYGEWRWVICGLIMWMFLYFALDVSKDMTASKRNLHPADAAFGTLQQRKDPHLGRDLGGPRFVRQRCSEGGGLQPSRSPKKHISQDANLCVWNDTILSEEPYARSGRMRVAKGVFARAHTTCCDGCR